MLTDSPHHAGAGQTDFEFLIETKVSPSIGLLGLVNIDLSGLYNNQFALHVSNTAATGPVVQVRPWSSAITAAGGMQAPEPSDVESR